MGTDHKQLPAQARVWHVGSATISRICGMLADQSDEITQVRSRGTILHLLLAMM